MLLTRNKQRKKSSENKTASPYRGRGNKISHRTQFAQTLTGQALQKSCEEQHVRPATAVNWLVLTAAQNSG